MPLSESQKKHLRGLAHKLRPFVMVGQQGLRESVHEELEQALTAHELVKVKVAVGDRTARDAVIRQLCEQSGAELVQRIGNMAVLFRRNPKKPRIELPRH
ncbi:MAG: ribosome assembly RNA-binding protein YhbY [Gammaproteobacteria bacterium]|nr:MAG: ribosome assembly RNA-binding protein YhbY [Gammaproteobacteria bacterium]